MQRSLFLTLLILGLAFSGKGKDIKVSNGGCDGDYSTVAAAITAAAAGSTIVLCPGVYTETVTIDKSLTLRGTTKNGATSEIQGTIFVTSADNIGIHDLTITPDSEEEGIEANGVKGLKITGCTITVVEDQAINIEDSSDVTIEKNTILLQGGRLDEDDEVSAPTAIEIAAEEADTFDVVIQDNQIIADGGKWMAGIVVITEKPSVVRDIKILRNNLDFSGAEESTAIVFVEDDEGQAFVSSKVVIEGNKVVGDISTWFLYTYGANFHNLVIKNNELFSGIQGHGIYWENTVGKDVVIEGNKFTTEYDSIVFDADQCNGQVEYTKLQNVQIRKNKFTSAYSGIGSYTCDNIIIVVQLSIVGNEFVIPEDDVPVYGFWAMVDKVEFEKNKVTYVPVTVVSAVSRKQKEANQMREAQAHRFGGNGQKKQAVSYRVGQNAQKTGRFSAVIIGGVAAVVGLLVVALAVFAVRRVQAKKYTPLLEKF